MKIGWQQPEIYVGITLGKLDLFHKMKRVTKIYFVLSASNPPGVWSCQMPGWRVIKASEASEPSSWSKGCQGGTVAEELCLPTWPGRLGQTQGMSCVVSSQRPSAPTHWGVSNISCWWPCLLEGQSVTRREYEKPRTRQGQTDKEKEGKCGLNGPTALTVMERRVCLLVLEEHCSTPLLTKSLWKLLLATEHILCLPLSLWCVCVWSTASLFLFVQKKMSSLSLLPYLPSKSIFLAYSCAKTVIENWVSNYREEGRHFTSLAIILDLRSWDKVYESRKGHLYQLHVWLNILWDSNL